MIKSRDRFRCRKDNGFIQRKSVIEVKWVDSEEGKADSVQVEVIEGPRLGSQLTCSKAFIEDNFEKVAN